jgi:hypothetical protein
MTWVGTEIFWPWYTLIGAMVCLGVARLLSIRHPGRHGE